MTRHASRDKMFSRMRFGKSRPPIRKEQTPFQTSVTIGDMVGSEVNVSLGGFTGVWTSRELATGVAAVVEVS